MEEKKANRNPSAGIPEAIHPEIGNGAAWEQKAHDFLLKHPDPTKQLDEYLIPEQNIPEDSTFIKHSEKEPSIPETDIGTSTEIVTITTGEPDNKEVATEQFSDKDAYSPVSGETRVVDEKVDFPKRKKKNKPAREEKGYAGEEPGYLNPSEEGEKPLKAGKLVRKAAKSVKKQEEEKNLFKKQVPESPEMTLSPYTRWLKSLAGSEYVHPYEDDFAFNRGEGSTKEGISETFADLLAAQGYKEQALEMYMKLMEKYPEKSGFFAAKIEGLQH